MQTTTPIYDQLVRDTATEYDIEAIRTRPSWSLDGANARFHTARAQAATAPKPPRRPRTRRTSTPANGAAQ